MYGETQEVITEVEMDELNNLLIPLTEKKEGSIQGEVIWNDHYGNSQTNIVPADLEDLGFEFGSTISLIIRESIHQVKWHKNFQEIGVGNLGLITDSWGMIAISVQNGSSVDSVETTEGTEISISLDNPT